MYHPGGQGRTLPIVNVALDGTIRECFDPSLLELPKQHTGIFHTIFKNLGPPIHGCSSKGAMTQCMDTVPKGLRMRCKSTEVDVGALYFVVLYSPSGPYLYVFVSICFVKLCLDFSWLGALILTFLRALVSVAMPRCLIFAFRFSTLPCLALPCLTLPYLASPFLCWFVGWLV